MKCFIECTVEFVVVTDRFTRRFHFGREVSIKTANLVKGEYRNLNVPTLLFGRVNIKNALLLEALAQNNFGSNICQAVTRRLGKERNRTGRTRVYFNDEYVIVFINDELNVVKANNTNAKTKLFCILQNGALDFIGNTERRINADRVTRVDTRALYKLHNTGNEYVTAVANRIHFHFFTLNVVVYKNGLICIDIERGLEITAKLILICNNLHSTSAKNKAGTNKHGVTDALCRFYTFFNGGNTLALRLRNVQFRQNTFKALAVLGSVDRLAIGTDNFDTAIHQRLRQVDSGLTAQGCNNTFGIFKIDDRHNVLGSKGLKIELICRGVIGRYRFGVVVNDNCFVSLTLNGLHGVYGRIVELNALTDTNGAGTKNNDLFLIRQAGIVLTRVRGIEICNIFAGVHCVNHTEHGGNAGFLTLVVNRKLIPLPKFCNELIGESHLLCGKQSFFVSYIACKGCFHIDNALEAFEEQLGDFGNLVKLFNTNAHTHQLANGINVIVAIVPDILKELCLAHVVELGKVEVANADFERTN